jgi:hypothetical protein
MYVWAVKHDHLHWLVMPHITEKDMIMRKSIPAEYALHMIFYGHVFDVRMSTDSVKNYIGQFS